MAPGENRETETEAMCCDGSGQGSGDGDRAPRKRGESSVIEFAFTHHQGGWKGFKRGGKQKM